MTHDAADWTIDRSTGDIRYTGDDHDGASPSYSTVIEIHRWLQDLADDAVASGDDELDITNTNPSQRSTDNIITLINDYNIGPTEQEHIYDGSIIQNGGDDIYDGIVNYGNSDVQIQVIQSGVVISDDWWNYSGVGLNADSTNGISHRFMIKTKSSGVTIDNGKLIGTCRRWGYSYSEFIINSASRGNNVLALVDSADSNNANDTGTVSGWTTIVNGNEGYTGIDVNNDGTNEYYYSHWDKATYSMAEFYERMKYLTRDGTTDTLYGLTGEVVRGITHEIVLTQIDGTWTEPEQVSWAVDGGVPIGNGQLYAVDSTTAATKMWIQLLNGSAPTGAITGISSNAHATWTSNTERSISKPFCGPMAGAAIDGAYGFGIEYADLSASDTLRALDDVQYNPPNNVQNTVTGIVSGEDRVLVAPWDGSSYDTNGDPAIDKTQYTLGQTLSTANITGVVVGETIAADTPNNGYIRVTDDNGFERRLHYQAWENGSPNHFYSIDTTDGNEDFDVTNATSGNAVWNAYIDELATSSAATYTSVQTGTRNLVVVVRDGGSTPIKQFISTWSQSNTPASISVIRTSDT